MKMIKKGEGAATLSTVSGGSLTAMLEGEWIAIKDEKGNVAPVTIGDVFQSDGVIDVVDHVLMPS